MLPGVYQIGRLFWSPGSEAGTGTQEAGGKGEGRGGLHLTIWLKLSIGGAGAAASSVRQPPNQPHSGLTVLHPAPCATSFKPHLLVPPIALGGEAGFSSDSQGLIPS